MVDLFGIIFLICVAVAIVLSTIQILRDRKRYPSSDEGTLDSSQPLSIDIHESSSHQQPACAQHATGHSNFAGDHGCGDFGGGHHH